MLFSGLLQFYVLDLEKDKWSSMRGDILGLQYVLYFFVIGLVFIPVAQQRRIVTVRSPNKVSSSHHWGRVKTHSVPWEIRHKEGNQIERCSSAGFSCNPPMG